MKTLIKIFVLFIILFNVDSFAQASKTTVTEFTTPIRLKKVPLFNSNTTNKITKFLSVDYLGNVVYNPNASFPGLAEVATTGDYNDLSNLPTLPTAPDYKEYNILLSQESTNNPVIYKTIVNTLGITLTWTRTTEGIYRSSSFTVPDFNTVSIIYNDADIPYQLESRVNIVYLNSTTAQISINRFNYSNPLSPVPTDGISEQFTILMRVSNN